MHKVLTIIILTIVRLYRVLLSPLLPHSCRFYPTCAAYAEEALSRFGMPHGISLALRRLARCHPLHHGGLDPLPEAARSGLATRAPDVEEI